MLDRLLILFSVIVGIGRFAIPKHSLSLSGSYEAFAHIFVGILLCLAIQKNKLAFALLVLLSAIELYMFLN